MANAALPPMGWEVGQSAWGMVTLKGVALARGGWKLQAHPVTSLQRDLAEIIWAALLQQVASSVGPQRRKVPAVPWIAMHSLLSNAAVRLTPQPLPQCA